MRSSVLINSRRRWYQAGAAFLFLLAWTVFWFRDTASAIVTIWLRSDTFAHGFLVFPIVVWLVWRRRQSLATLDPNPSGWGVLLLAVAAFAWLLGDLVAVNALTQLAFVSMLVLLVPSVFGFAVSRAIAFPLAFMFFSVPFGEFAMPQLMSWTADFTVLALRFSGIPVYREGLQFVIPSGNWSVVEACSGVRYLIASLTVGTLFAYLNYQSTKRRVLFIIVSILVPVVANWLRAYLIVMLGHVSGNKLAVGVDHLIYGWLFFGIVILLMFMIGARWSEPEPSAIAADTDTVILQRALAPSQTNALSRFTVVAAALTLLVALPHMARWALSTTADESAPQLVAPALLSGAWVAAPDEAPTFKPAFQNPSAEFNVTYKSGPQAVGLYLGYYRQQDYTRKLISSENVLVKSKDPLWTQVSGASRKIGFMGQPATVRTAELRGFAVHGQPADERLTVWQIYWVNGTFTASNSLAKAYGAFYRLLGRGDDSAVIIVYAPKGQGGDGDARLQAFVGTNAFAIEALLEQTKRSSRPK